MKWKRTTFLTKIVVLALLVGSVTGLLELRSQLNDLQLEQESLARQIAVQTQVNVDLLDAVEGSQDPERQADIAREQFGLVESDEYIIYFTD